MQHKTQTTSEAKNQVTEHKKTENNTKAKTSAIHSAQGNQTPHKANYDKPPKTTREGKLGVIQAKQRPVQRQQTANMPARAQSDQADKIKGVNNSDKITPGDFYDKQGYYLGTDGKDDKKVYIVRKKEDRKKIKKNEKKDSITDLNEVESAFLISTGESLRESLNVLDRTKKTTASDDEGGKHEESSIVMNDGKVLRGESGKKAKYGENETASASIPKLPEGSTNKDVAALIHSHPTESKIIKDIIFSFSTQEPTKQDLKNGLEKFQTNIIAGRLGYASGKTDASGRNIKTDAKLGISVYTKSKNGRVDLKVNQVKRILKNQIKRGKLEKE